MRKAQRRARKQRRRGFTLMEVLLVMAILVILGTLVVMNFTGLLGNQQKKAALTQMNLFKTPLGTYFLDMGTYPSPQDGLKALTQPPSTNTQKWAGPYISEEIPNDPWGQPYQYNLTQASSTTGASTPKVVLSSNGPDMQPGTADDITVNAGG